MKSFGENVFHFLLMHVFVQQLLPLVCATLATIAITDSITDS